VIVTGAAGGLGAGVVRRVLARGDANVVAVDSEAEALGALEDEVAERERLHCITADISSAAAVEAFVEEGASRWDGLDGIFNAAGSAPEGSILEMSLGEYDRAMSTNADSAWLAMKYAMPALRERGGGRIVNSGSHLASRGGANLSACAASEHAILGMTRCLALEFLGDNVAINALCAGTDRQLMWEELTGAPPRRRPRSDELAAVGSWLLFDAPSFITGQVMHIDGGLQAG
jgi:NAD(P)-dependent dehydrogenase (short-subunit alcohol dehydrogenase family)